MDRRRFVPSSEGLEGRALLSTVTPGAAPVPATTAAVNGVQAQTSGLPESYDQKLQRIENLPYFLQQLQPGRFLPTDTIQSIQANLVSVAAKLQGPPPATLDNFNLELRDTIADASLSAQNANGLNRAFSQVLTGAGATPAQVAEFAADMNQLAMVDSQSPNPTYLAANDYAVILQTALAVGRPIVTPRAPRLSPDSGTTGSDGAATTTDPTPILIGAYESGASTSGTTRVEILDANGNVLGSGPVEQNGRYAVTLTVPLAVGRYNLKARAVDILGNQSKEGPALPLRVVSPPSRPTVSAQVLVPPGGPLALRRR